jgi:acyl-CoA thioester hydrolase
MLKEHEIQIRVRYPETDRMGFLHHSHYFTYFEMGRIELLRAEGGNHRRMEDQGKFAVVVRAECRYHRPARYDDLLTLRTSVAKITPAKIEHEYRLFRDSELLAVGHITLAIMDRDGNVIPVPDELLGA